jgi:hypothetical protein
LWFVAEKTGFLRTFTHVLDRYVKHDPDPRELRRHGTNMGLQKMADVSGLSHAVLQTTARNFLRTESLHPDMGGKESEEPFGGLRVAQMTDE